MFHSVHKLLIISAISCPAYALTTVVPSGDTETTTLTLSNDGDKAIVEEGGAIETAGASGIDMLSSNQVVLNQGKITVTGDSGIVVVNSISNFSVTNNGQISTIDGSTAILVGAGVAANNALITNNGSILTNGDLSSGIRSFSFASSIISTNNGLILTTGIGSRGISTGGPDAVVTNNGLILTSGDFSTGIFNTTASDNTVTINTGQILTKGVNAHGIRNIGINGHIINSGTVRSARGFVLNLQGANPTITLLRGSNLQGAIRSTADPLNLTVETGLNLALILDPASMSFGNLRIDAPFAQVDQTIAVIDPTGLALQADVVADLSDAILDNIYRNKIGFPCPCNPCGCGPWIQGIGSYRKRNHNRERVGYDNWQGGFLIGYDSNICGGNGRLFGGISFGEATVDEYTQQADWTSYMGGIAYEQYVCDTFLGLAFAAGYIGWENKRFVMNNLADEGVEIAKANIHGMFVSPELSVAHSFSYLWCCPTMSCTIRYAGLFLGDYHEKGSLADLSIKNREIDLLTTRFEFSLPYTALQGTCCWSIEPYIGVLGRYQVGGYPVEAELFGQSLRFTPGGPRNLAAFLLGFRGTQSLGCFDCFLNLEGSFDNYSSSRLLGEGGINFNF